MIKPQDNIEESIIHDGETYITVTRAAEIKGKSVSAIHSYRRKRKHDGSEIVRSYRAGMLYVCLEDIVNYNPEKVGRPKNNHKTKEQ